MVFNAQAHQELRTTLNVVCRTVKKNALINDIILHFFQQIQPDCDLLNRRFKKNNCFGIIGTQTGTLAEIQIRTQIGTQAGA